MRGARGLTLVELLVAIAIFGVLSGFAYRALTVVLESRGRIEQENRKWREIALFFTRLEQDLAASAPRPVRDANGSLSPALVGNPAPKGAADGAIVLTRTGLAADPGTIEPPRRIGYRVRGGVVEMLYWSGLEVAPRSEPRTVAVLFNVSALDLRYLDRRGQWHRAWPPAGTNNPQTEIPAGIEVGVTLVTGERITRLLPTAVRSAL
ncbi:MAG: type II secretion system minor pseudopilin GspJ [Burkholderiales bacterium]|jgi:general secretion pathway protein J